MEKVAFMGLDVHPRHCVLGWMDAAGTYRNEWRFATSEAGLIRQITRVEAQQKIFTVEESSLALWVARTVRPYVEELIVCDPRENDLISKNVHKSDGVDTYQLCRLTRLGELKRVYQAEEDHREIFKEAAQEYTKLRDRQKAFKNRIKDKFRRWGVHEVAGSRVYQKRHREAYLKRLPNKDIRRQLERIYALMDAAVEAQQDAWRHLKQLGRRYEEIKEFVKVPGMGPIGSHLFDAIIQTPYRFKNKRKIWRYCGLGICSRTSGGKQLGYERLDKSGHGELKAVSSSVSSRSRRRSCRGQALCG